MILLSGEITEKAQQELLSSRFNGGYIDVITTCLERAEAIAGLISSTAGMSLNNGVNDGLCPLHIYHSANALEQVIIDAKIILEDCYQQTAVELENNSVEKDIEGK